MVLQEERISSYNTVAAGSTEQYVYYHIPIHSYSLKTLLKMDL
jgi:hypothetical protein